MVLVLIILGLFAATRPVKQFDEMNMDENTLTELIGNKLLDSVMDMMTTGNNGLEFQLSEEELNGIFASNLKDQDDINAIHCNIHEDKIVFYIDTDVLGLISTQVIIHTKLTLVDRQMKVQLEKVSIGRLPVPKSILFSMLKDGENDFVIDREQSTLIIPVELPEVTRIEDFRIEDNLLRFKLKVSISSMSDVLSLFEYFKEKEK